MNTAPSLRIREEALKLLRLFCLPFAFYLVCFIALTYPAILRFGSHFWTGAGDGLVMFWNMWWVDKALTDLHQHPWFTQYLFHPEGASLLVHTMHPLKGVMAIPLLRIMSPMATYNTLVIFTFAMTGVTAFWLSRALTRAYWPSIAGGFIFTFCNYHFAHAQGHMHLISLEWMPVFVLLWYRWLESPRALTAVGAAVMLMLVLLCSSYNFLYCVMTGVVMVCWYIYKKRSPFFLLGPRYRGTLVLFVLLCVVTCGPLTGAMLHAMRSDSPILAPASRHSMDLLAVVIPGGHWRFGDLTRGYWSRIPGKVHGNSVNLGVSVMVLLACAFARRKKIAEPNLLMWYAVALFFAVMALGPKLYIWGWEAPYIGDPEYRLIKMPYSFLSKVTPGSAVGSHPNRLIVMTALSVAVIAAFSLRDLFAAGRNARLAAAGILCLLVVEYLPSPLPAFEPQVPEHVRVLADIEGDGAVFDLLTPTPLTMLYQTIHKRPIESGVVSRVLASTRVRRRERRVAYEEKRYSELRDRHDYRFLIVPPEDGSNVLANCSAAVLLCQDDERHLFDLAPPQKAASEIDAD